MAPIDGAGGIAWRDFALPQSVRFCFLSAVKMLTTEAEVDAQGWLNIHVPAPPGTAPGKVEAVVVLSPPNHPTTTPARPRAGTLSGRIELAPDFHAPAEDFQDYTE